MPASDIGIDLGTRNSQVYSTGKGLVLMEPTVAVYDKDSRKNKGNGRGSKADGRACFFQYGDYLAHSPRCDYRLHSYGENAEVLHFKGNGTQSFPQAKDQHLYSQRNH